MIFIGAELSDPHAHFVTNIISCIGSGEDLIIDLLDVHDSATVFQAISEHLQRHREEYVIYNAYTDEDFFLGFREYFPELKLITVFSDDEWRHFNYDRYIALYSDVFTIAVKDHIQKYNDYGLQPFYMQWACNPEMFYPLAEREKDIDVSFVGAAYGRRIAYVKFLIRNGVNIRVFGKGWDKFSDIRQCWGGYLSNKGMLDVIARSKINLNFLWTSADKERCTIKARTLELSACRAFQLSNFTHEFFNYGFVDGKNIAIFEGEKAALEKIRFYLENDDKRESIAGRAYDHVLEKHTWEQRFDSIFDYLKHEPASNEPVHFQSRVLVVIDAGVQHLVDEKDERMHIRIVESSHHWEREVEAMDGVIFLKHDSTINNESLYMMVFGLQADQSDVIAANFRVGAAQQTYWIRVIDQVVRKKPGLIHMLPQASLMFSGAYVSEQGGGIGASLRGLNVSFVEHPSYWIRLPYWKARQLRLYFSYHGDSRQQFGTYLRSFKFGKALSLGIDKIWQKVL